MGKVVFYTRSGKVNPASYHRLIQYATKLDRDVICRPIVCEYLYKKHENAKSKWDKLLWYSLFYLQIQWNVFRFMLADIIDKPDCIVIQRALSPKIILFFNKLVMKKALEGAKKLVWDFDDEIFICKEITPFESQLLQNNATSIVVTHEYLKSRLSAQARQKTILMPTTDCDFILDDENEVMKLRKSSFDKQIRLLWLATWTGLPHLHHIVPALDKAAEAMEKKWGKQLVLHVVCNKPLEFDAKHLVVDNIVWTREIARQLTREAHIGIMPLKDSEFSKGKGGFKIVQYMSASMPAIASAVGYNTEIIDHEQSGILVDDRENIDGWIDAVLALGGEWQIYQNTCETAKKLWDEKFSFNKNLDIWNEIIS